jgi:hypothetical protein
MRQLQKECYGSTSRPEPEILNAYLATPTDVKPGDHYGYKIIACVWEGWNGWCAYRAPTNWTDAQAAAFGDEIPRSIAEALFPALAHNRSYGGT